MKKLFLLLLVFVAAPGIAQEVNFTDNWDEALAQSKEEQKPILIDFYTDWCGWCKVQDTATWKDPMVADFINEHFVSVKLNAEKEGGDVALRFRPRGYPTVMLFDPNSENPRLITYVGYNDDNEAYIEKIKEDLKSGWSTLGYDPTGSSPEFPEFIVAKYSQSRSEFPKDSELVDWFNNHGSLTDEAAWSVLLWGASSLPDEITEQVIPKLDNYADTYGEDAVKSFLESHYYKVIFSTTSKEELDKAIADASEIDRDETNFDFYRIAWYSQKGDWANYIGLIKQMAEDNDELGADYLNDQLWTLVSKECEDESLCNEAAELLASYLDEDPDPNHLDTLAWLYYRSGDMQKAESTAKRAIELDSEMESSKELLTLMGK